ncbi:MAG: hypothetical protein IPH87_03585 [Anaerolineae bacterium]|nr:hypothetical protein [Anaerolineae bacterium]
MQPHRQVHYDRFRALADYDDVSPETKSLVRCAWRTGLHPQPAGAAPRKRRSDTIGLILPTFGPRLPTPSSSEFLAGVGNMAAEHGYDLLSFDPGAGRPRCRFTARRCRAARWMVSSSCAPAPRHAHQLPGGDRLSFVAFGRTENDLDFPFVDVDSIQGMRLIAEHLIGLGHCRLACLAPPSDLLFAEQRLNGLRQALTDHGLALPGAGCVG